MNVIEALNEVGGNDKYFDIHTPIIYNKKKFLELENFDWKKEYVIKSLYTNLQKFITLEEMTDCKINRNMTYDEIKALILGRTFFSIGDYGVCPGMKKILNDYFPNKSIYEK